MIASIPRKTGDRPRTFKHTVQYVLHSSHDPAIVGGTIGGLTAKERESGRCDPGRAAEIVREFEAVRQLRPVVKDPVVHMSLSFAPDDRRLKHSELAEMAEKFVARLGYTGCQYVVVEHNDRSHQHLHIVLNRVRLDASLNPRPHNDWFKAMDVCRQLEAEYGLKRVERPRETGLRAPSRAEIEHGAKVGQPSERMLLQAAILPVAQARPSLPQFVDELQQQGISVRFHLGPDEKPIGISYQGGKYAFAGSALGPSYTFNGIQREGVRVDAMHDVGVIRELAIIRPQAPKAPAPTISPELAERLRAAITDALSDRPSLDVFVRRLKGTGVELQMNVAATGYVSGVRFNFEGATVRGSQLGREFSLEGLRRQGLQIDPERDAELIEGLASPRSRKAEARPQLSADQLVAVQAAVTDALTGRPDVTTFVERLVAKHIAVRFAVSPDGRVVSSWFECEGVAVGSRKLGDLYSWPNLVASGLRLDPDKDSQTIQARAVLSRRLNPDEVQYVRSVVATALLERPSLSAFVDLLAARAVDVRIFTDPAGQPFAIGYGLDGTWVSAAELGESYRWHQVIGAGLHIDPERDKYVLDAVTARVPSQDSRTLDALHAADRVLYVASMVRLRAAPRGGVHP